MTQNTIYILIAISALIIIWSVVTNNRIISKKNRLVQAFGSIEIYLKKRFDLVPNLIALLKKYMEHEKDILIQVTELRSEIERSENADEKIKASNELTKVVAGLSLVVENYPNIKADQQFKNVQYEMIDLEDQISAARRSYNAAVTDFNNLIEKFPASIIASLRKDRSHQLLEIPKEEQKDVKISDLMN